MISLILFNIEVTMQLFYLTIILLIIKEGLKNLEFINNIDQFDILVDSASNDQDITTIQEVVLSNYEDLIK